MNDVYKTTKVCLYMEEKIFIVAAIQFLGNSFKEQKNNMIFTLKKE